MQFHQIHMSWKTLRKGEAPKSIENWCQVPQTGGIRGLAERVEFGAKEGKAIVWRCGGPRILISGDSS